MLHELDHGTGGEGPSLISESSANLQSCDRLKDHQRCSCPNAQNLWPFVCDKGGSADVINFGIFRWGEDRELSRWAQCNHKGP